MYREDDDGVCGYSTEEIFGGEIVKMDNISGYYSCKASKSYANPFLVKLVKRLWSEMEECLIVGEMLGGD